MPDVKSSAIEHIDHDGHGLVVIFRGGRRYRYPTAGEEHVEQLAGAESPGRYFSEHIKPHHDHEVRYG